MLIATLVVCLAQPPVPAPPVTRAETVAGEAGLPKPAAPALAAHEVSAERMKADVERLAAFGTRHTLSTTTDPARGIGAARKWLFDEMVRAGVPAVNLETHEVPRTGRLPNGATVVNVVGVIPGTDAAHADRLYYVVGHYDSRNGEAMDGEGDAPGANDDASGTSVVLEAARVVMKHRPRATVVLLATAAEEQGLIGAARHAGEAAAKGARILGVLSHDIVGDPSPAGPASGTDAATVRVFSEGVARNAGAEAMAVLRANSMESDSPSRQLARYVEEVGRREGGAVRPVLRFRPDRFLRGGDHSAFNEAGYAAVRFTAPAEDYSRQHADVTVRDGKPYGDVPEFVDAKYLAGVARLNVLALLHMANAPAPPVNPRLATRELTRTTTVNWEAAPGGADGYEVVWRDTTDWRWTHAKDVGAATSVTLELSKDDWFFGVRAYFKDGYRSPVVFATAEMRARAADAR